MVASHHREEALGVWPGALLDIFDPRSVDPERNPVFGLAGDRAGMTANALGLIDDEPVSQLALPGSLGLETVTLALSGAGLSGRLRLLDNEVVLAVLFELFLQRIAGVL